MGTPGLVGPAGLPPAGPGTEDDCWATRAIFPSLSAGTYPRVQVERRGLDRRPFVLVGLVLGRYKSGLGPRSPGLCYLRTTFNATCFGRATCAARGGPLFGSKK